MSKKSKKKKSSSYKKKTFNPIPLVVAILVLILLGLIAALVLKQAGYIGTKAEEEPEASAEIIETQNTDEGMIDEKWREGIISYNGKKYEYNSDLDVYLLMGIDTDEPVSASANYMEGHQADALFLLVANRVEETLKVISIHRNTITEIYTCDEEGNFTGYADLQICLAHGYGDGKRLSCERQEDAVATLFYGIPIDGYLSLNLGGIGSINSLVGGVTLTPIMDLDFGDIHLKKGEKVTLSDDAAYRYLRYRDTNEFDSASQRQERQKQYIDAYLQQLRKGIKGGLVKASQIYNSIADYSVTNLPLEKVIKTLMKYSYESEDMLTVKGEVVQGEVYEEFYADDDALYQMIIDNFYKEVE